MFFIKNNLCEVTCLTGHPKLPTHCFTGDDMFAFVLSLGMCCYVCSNQNKCTLHPCDDLFDFLVRALRSETIACISVTTKTNPVQTEVCCYIVQSFKLHKTDEIQSLRVCLSGAMCTWLSQLSILPNLNNQHKSITILCRPSRTVAAVHVACPSCIVDTLYNGNESRATGRVVV